MRIDIQNHPEFTKWVGLGMQASMGQALLSTATRLVQVINTEIIPETQPNQPVDRGTYRAGWRVEAAEGKVFLVNTVKHAPIIEWGARAANIKVGRKMITALAAWVKRKGLAKDRAKETSAIGKTFQKTSMPVSANPYTQAAWAIAMSMKKKGIFGGDKSPSGLMIVRRAMTRFDRFFSEEMKRSLKNNIR